MRSTARWVGGRGLALRGTACAVLARSAATNQSLPPPARRGTWIALLRSQRQAAAPSRLIVASPPYCAPP